MRNSERITKKYERKHLEDIKKYQYRIRRAYNKAVDKIFAAISSIKKKGDTFDITKYPKINKLVDDVLVQTHEEISTIIINGIHEQWNLSESKTDELIKDAIGKKGDLPQKVKAALFSRNDAALNAFVARTTGKQGLSLSDRIWKYNQQFRREIEQMLYVGINNGESASTMATKLKQYMREPDRLFRRVRDTDGKLKLSKPAQSFHSGQGVYRSSYKNALRLARTETNMAYRAADGESYSRTKFILGFEVKLSANHPKFDICDHLAGVYPASFKFVGWHPNCMCYTVPVLPSADEYDRYEVALLKGRGDQFKFSGTITNIPNNFTAYISKNSKDLANLRSQPYWIRDNIRAIKKLKLYK